MSNLQAQGQYVCHSFAAKTFNLANTTRNIIILFLLAAVTIAAYSVGKWMGNKSGETKLIQNYSFVRHIVELATLEVNGSATFKTTNVDQDDSWWSSMQAFFTEKSATINIPYQAKYGVDMSKDSIHIVRKDSVVEIQLQAPKLLSYEMRLDRMETTSRKGLLVFQEDEFFNSFQKKMYAETRQQLATNNSYLKQSERLIEEVLTQYYQPLGVKAKCVFR